MFIYEAIVENKNIFLIPDFFTLIRVIVFIIISIINVIFDIKYKRIILTSLIIPSVIFLIIWIILKPVILINILIGLIVLIVFYIIILIISKGQTGLGDMLYLMFFNVLFGYLFTVSAFLFSYWIASIILIVPLLLKKINLKAKIPFIPFLFIGSMITLIYMSFIFKL